MLDVTQKNQDYDVHGQAYLDQARYASKSLLTKLSAYPNLIL